MYKPENPRWLQLESAWTQRAVVSWV